jgi:hypothetical protein
MQQPESSAGMSPFAWPVPAPGPSWNIPRISLPSCLGPLLDFEQEWWYYAGYATDSNNNRYSLQFSVNRFSFAIGDSATHVIACLTGIGNAADNSYFFNTSFGMGVSNDASNPQGLTLPTVTDSSFALTTHPAIGDNTTSVSYTGGEAVGTTGSTYQLNSSATTPVAAAAQINLADERGMIMEWQSGYIGPDKRDQFSNASYEFAQPRLKISSGTITLNGKPVSITGGHLWLDRQVITSPPSAGTAPVTAQLMNGLLKMQNMKALYRGSWFGITLDSGATMVCACFWQEPAAGKLQWQTGTLLGLPPLTTYANLYYPLPADGDLRRIANGGSYLRGIEKEDAEGSPFDFDINILTPDTPGSSPHWQSPLLEKPTYSNGWWIRVDPKWESFGLPSNLYLKALVNGCENALPCTATPLVAYWEGAATVFSDAACTQPIGSAFVEQMGFN